MSGNTLSLGQQANFHAAVLKALPRNISPQDALSWEENGEKLTATLASALCPPAAPAAKPPTLVLIKTIAIGDVEGRRTTECLTGNIWGYRDPNIDNWLPELQPAQTGGPVGVYQLQKQKGVTFRDMVAAVLQVSLDTALGVLAKVLKKQGHTFTLPAVENLVERQEAGEDVGLCTDGRANLFPVEDSDGCVSVLYTVSVGDGWRGRVYRLDDGAGWSAKNRLLLRNPVTLTL